MKKAMKTLSVCLIGASTLFASVNADTCCTTDTCCDMSGTWELGLELLYWKPCTCAFEYASLTINTSPLVTNVQRVKPANKPGWRLFAAYRPCDSCTFYMVDWAYVRATDTSTVARTTTQTSSITVPGLIASTAQFVEGQQRSIYSRINLRTGYYLHRSPCVEFYAYGGFRFLDFNHYRRASGESTEFGPFTFRQRSEFAGAGVELGVGGRYDLGCCIGLVGNMGLSAAVGQQKLRVTHDFETPNSQLLQRRYDAQTHCVPGIDLRVGIDYTRECSCFTLIGEIGYEVNHYFGALRVPNVSFNTDQFTSCMNFGFAGPYASLRLQY